MLLTFNADIFNDVVPTLASTVSVGALGMTVGTGVGCRARGYLFN